MRKLSILAAVAVALLATSPVHAQRVLGLDVSAWQTEITTTEWATLKRPVDQQVGGVFGDGRDFVFIRSSRGGTTGYYDQNNSDNNPPTNTLSQRYDDPYYIQNINRASAAGLFAGTYHFSRPDIIETTLNSGGIANTGTDEADHFMQMAGQFMRPGYLVPIHDLEAGDGVRSDSAMGQFALDFSNRIHAVTGVRPGIYINGNYAANIIAGSTTPPASQVVGAYPVLWSARWPNQADPGSIDVQNGQPKDSYTNIYGPWDDAGVTHPWSFWQYASTMRLNGNNNQASNTDVNVANGGIEFLKDRLVPALWMNDNNGEWTTLANWNSGGSFNAGQPQPVSPVQGSGQVARVGPLTLPTPRLPGAAGSGVNSGQHDTVILDRPSANITVTLSSGTHNIRKLYVKETLAITGGSLNINYTPSADSTPISAQFSGAVSLGGAASLSVHTLQVDTTRTFTVGGDANLAFRQINLMPGATPGKILLNGDVNLASLDASGAVVANGAGGGTAGRIDLGGAARELTVADGAADADLAINVPIINGGLTKSGAGTLALGGANTYAGDTVVEAGKLRNSIANFANGADLYLTTGALLDLTFSAGTPDVIDSLFIDGVSQVAGIWGAVGSGAPLTSPLITGTGRLQVTTYLPPPPPIPGDFNGDDVVNSADLPFWKTGYGMSIGATAAHGDADADGDVDGADFLVWNRNLGMSQATAAASPATAAVPEPHAAAMALVAAAALLGRRMRR